MRTRTADGFTLIELMIVVIIIAALASMVAPRLMERSDEAKAKISEGDIANISLALKLFRLDNDYYPSTQEGLEALMTKPSSAANWKGPYLETRPLDPWKRTYQYRYPGTHNAGGFDLFSTGKDGAEGKDDVTNWQ
jgi:general secretion pathway protein G